MISVKIQNKENYFSMHIYILEMKREHWAKRNTSNPHLLDSVNAALTSWTTGWSGACTRSLGNGSVGRLQEEQVLRIKYTHTQVP